MSATETAGASAFARYDLWNAAVEAEFFDGSFAGRPVYLDMEDDVVVRLAELAGVEGDPASEFSRAVQPTLYLPPEKGGCLLDLHVKRVRRWRYARDDSPPPCLAILAFFALAAEGMRGDEHFGANNYYGRLTERLGINPISKVEYKEKIASDFRRDSAALWSALNSWLMEHDGSVGTPTAFAFDWRSYVSVPISQALLREEERRELRKLFLAFRLSPGQQIATSDMLRLLKEWIPKADISADLKRLFAQADAQARIADIACVELQAWDGSLPVGFSRDVDPSTALLVSAQVRRVPRSQLMLNLVLRGSSPVPEGQYHLTKGSAAPAEAAFSGSEGKARIVGARGDGWRRVETDAVIAFPDLLVSTVRLEGESGAWILRKPRRLVILERDEEYLISVEVDRIQLARDNILLAHQTLADEVDRVIATCARDGFTRWSPQSLRGLPDDWVAWTGVEIMTIPDVEETPELAALVPLEWTKIAISGGLSLPGYATWLREAPPEVRVTSVIDKDVTVALSQTMSLLGEPADDVELATFRGAAVLQLTPENLTDGDYRVSLREAGPRGGPLVSASFRIRSADLPRVAVDLEGYLSYRLEPSAPRAALTADITDALSEPCNTGAFVIPFRPLSASAAAVPVALAASPALDLESEAESEDTPTAATSGGAPSCLIGGAHSYRLPDATREMMLGKRTATTVIDARCSNCGYEKWFPPHTRAAKGFRTSKARIVVEQKTQQGTIPRASTQGAVPRLIAISEESGPGMEVLLHALSYARGGNWGLFERLAAQVGGEPWFALEAARTLASLGHIDLRVELATGRPTDWAVSPPTLYATEEGAVLTGARSDALTTRLALDVEALDGQLDVIENDAAPATLLIRGFAQEELQELASSLTNAAGRDVFVNEVGAAAIAAALPPLEAVLAELPPYAWPVVALERFDVDRNKWERAGALDRPGAYKFVTRPLRYAFVDASGGVTAGDNRLVKWLAARGAGQTLFAYDP